MGVLHNTRSVSRLGQLWLLATENVNIATCTEFPGAQLGGVVTLEPPSNPCSRYDSVSVAPENVVGVGAATTCTTQTISELPTYVAKYILLVKLFCTINAKHLHVRSLSSYIGLI